MRCSFVCSCLAIFSSFHEFLLSSYSFYSFISSSSISCSFIQLHSPISAVHTSILNISHANWINIFSYTLVFDGRLFRFPCFIFSICIPCLFVYVLYEHLVFRYHQQLNSSTAQRFANSFALPPLFISSSFVFFSLSVFVRTICCIFTLFFHFFSISFRISFSYSFPPILFIWTEYSQQFCIGGERERVAAAKKQPNFISVCIFFRRAQFTNTIIMHMNEMCGGETFFFAIRIDWDFAKHIVSMSGKNKHKIDDIKLMLHKLFTISFSSLCYICTHTRNRFIIIFWWCR